MRLGRNAVILLCLLLPAGLASASITLSPAKLELTLAPGERANGLFRLLNDGDQTLKFRVRVEDFFDQPEAYSLTPYLTPAIREFELRPGASREVAFTINLPNQISPGSLHGGLSFTAAPTDLDGPTAESRLGGLIFVRVPGEARPAGQLLKFERAATEGLIFNLTFGNSGNTYLNPYGQITLNQPGGSFVELESIVIDPWFVLPGAERTRQIEWPRQLPPGEYLAKLELNRGYGDIIDQVEINLKIGETSYFWVYLLIFLIGIGFGLWVIIKKRKRS